MSDATRPNYPIESVDRALRLLSTFRNRPAISLSEVADELAITRSSAHRLLAMFVWHGYAQQNPRTKEYLVGPRLLELGLGVLRQMEIVGRARPFIRELAERFGETVHLAVLTGSEVSFVDGIESTKPLRAGLRVGVSLPAHATATGKVLLAALPPAELDVLYPGVALDPCTPHTLGRRADLETELAVIRELGYAVNDQESEPGLVAVAVAFPDPTGVARAAVAVATPSVRADQAFLAELGQRMARQVTAPTGPGSSRERGAGA